MSSESASVSPVNRSVINFLDTSLGAKAEQNFSNISIKDEPLELTDNDSSEESSKIHSQIIGEKSTNSEPVVQEIDEYSNTRHDALVKSEDSPEYDSGDALHINNSRNYRNLGYADNEISKPNSDVLDKSESEQVLVESEAISPDTNSSTLPDSEDPLSDFLLLEDNTFSCSICSFTTDKRSRLNDHERNHRKTNLPIFRCFYCSQKYTRHMLYRHVQNVHPGQKFQIRNEEPKAQPGGSYKCSTCSFSTHHPNDFSLHEKEHLPQELNQNNGKSSDKSNCPVPEQVELIKPVGESNLQTPLKCPFCAFSTSEQVMLDLHKKSHVETHDRNIFDCPMCSYSCHSASRMSHIDTHKNNRPIQKCPKCYFRSTPTALFYHMKRCRRESKSASKRSEVEIPEQVLVEPHETTNLEPVTRTDANSAQISDCALCSYSISNTAKMRKHIYSHKKSRLIKKCPKCDFRSTSKAVTWHMKKCREKSNFTIRENIEDSNKEINAGQNYEEPTLKTSSKLKLKAKNSIFEPIKRMSPLGRTMYHCNICSYSCNKLVATIGHMNSHKNNLPIKKCSNCSFKSTSRAMKYHMKSCKITDRSSDQNSLNPFANQTLRAPLKLILKTKNSLMEPGKQIASGGRKIYNCKMCSYSCKTFVAIIRHNNSHKNNVPIVKCSNCTFKSTSRTIRFHMKNCKTIKEQSQRETTKDIPTDTKNGQNEEKCFSEPDILVDSEGSIIYKCRMCSYNSIKIVPVTRHLNSHKRNQPIIKCPNCNFESTVRALKCHRRKCKKSSKSVTVENIGNVYSEDDIQHNSEESSGLNPDICTSSVSVGQELKLPMLKNKHFLKPIVLFDSSGQIIYKCKTCSYESSLLARIIDHSISHKNNLPIIKCPNCSFKSTTRIVNIHKSKCKRNFKSAGEPKYQFSCPQCTFSTSLRIKLKFHMKKRHFISDRNFSCKFCSFSTAKTMYFEQHMKSHERNMPIKKCCYCNFKSTCNILRKHIHQCDGKTRKTSVATSEHGGYRGTERQNKSDYVDNTMEVGSKPNEINKTSNSQGKVTKGYSCELCSFVTSKSVSLYRHMAAHKRKQPIMQCPKCNFRSTPTRLGQHIETENHFRGTKCTLCSVVCADHLQLYKHIVSHRLNKPIRKCSNCNFRSTPNILRSHVCDKEKSGLPPEADKENINSKKDFITSGIKKYLFRCSQCEFLTSLRIKLKFHMKKCHKKLNAEDSKGHYKCRVCCYATDNKSNYKRHTIIHVNPTKRTIRKCKKCDFKSTHFELMMHSQKCQGDRIKEVSSDNSFQVVNEGSASSSQYIKKCPLCPYTSLYTRILKKHTETCHPNRLFSQKTFSDVYECDICKFTTLYGEKFRRHIEIEKHFSDVSERHSHDTGDDLELKSNDCPGKDQVQNKSIQNKVSQMKSDTSSSATVYKCSSCSFTTVYKGNLKRHIDLHVENKQEHSSDQSKIVSAVINSPCKKDQSYQKSVNTFGINQENLSKTVEVEKNPASNNEQFFMTFPGIYRCTVCSYSTSVRPTFLEHISAHKRKLPIRQCPSCSYKSTPKALSHHLLVCPNSPESAKITSKVPEVHKCNICSYSGSLKSSLKRHLSSHGIEKQPVTQCANCDFKGTRSVLEKHGPICPNRTEQKVLLTCSKCSYTTYYQKLINDHVDKNHPKKDMVTNDRPKSFKCQYCSFTSFWGYLIERHMNSHTLLKLPIEKCSRCEFRSTPAALTAHMNICVKKSNAKKLELTSGNNKRTDFSNKVKINENRINGVKKLKPKELDRETQNKLEVSLNEGNENIAKNNHKANVTETASEEDGNNKNVCNSEEPYKLL